jgi:hypothetical protein
MSRKSCAPLHFVTHCESIAASLVMGWQKQVRNSVRIDTSPAVDACPPGWRGRCEDSPDAFCRLGLACASPMPVEIALRPAAKKHPKKPKGPDFCRGLRGFESELRVLWTDQPRRPSAIDAPSHHGFDLYSHLRYQSRTISVSHSVVGYASGGHQKTCNLHVHMP